MSPPLNGNSVTKCIRTGKSRVFQIVTFACRYDDRTSVLARRNAEVTALRSATLREGSRTRDLAAKTRGSR